MVPSGGVAESKMLQVFFGYCKKILSFLSVPMDWCKRPYFPTACFLMNNYRLPLHLIFFFT